MRLLRIHQAVLVTSLLLVGGFQLLNVQDSEAAVSQFSITLSSNSVSIQVGPNQSARASLKGEITIHRFVPGVSRYLVYLYLEGDPPITGLVNPMIMEFTPGGARTLNFTVSIRAPIFTPHTDGVRNLPYTARVKGNWFSIPQGPAGSGEVPTESIMVNIEPYYYFTMNPDPPFKRVWPGATTSFEVEIYNQGNTYDTVYVEVDNEEVWADRGWAFEIPVPRVDVAPREYKSVEVIVHCPQNLVLWENSFVGISLLGYSERALYLHQNVEYHMSLYFQMWGFYLPEVAWAVVFALVFLLIFTLHRHGYLKRIKRGIQRRRAARKERKKRAPARPTEAMESSLFEEPAGGPPPPIARRRPPPPPPSKAPSPAEEPPGEKRPGRVEGRRAKKSVEAPPPDDLAEILEGAEEPEESLDEIL